MKLTKENLIKISRKEQTPLYVYDMESVRKAYKDLNNSFKNYSKSRIFYSVKANSNKAILKELLNLGAGLECVSVEEVKLGLSVGFLAKDILFTATSIKEVEMKYLISKKIIINVDSFSQLRRYSKLNSGGKISIRLNGDIGAGHHEHVVTGGANSKFGIHYSQIDDVIRLVKKFDLHIIGLHQHIGSNIFDEDIFIEAAELLMTEALKFKELEFLDFGGGFGIPYEEKEKPLNVKRLGNKMTKLFKIFNKHYGREISMVLEPGRYLVGHAGVLLVSVVDRKENPYKKFVCVDSGFNHLLRPAMYGSYHKVENISRKSGKKELITVAGNVCESGDIFANNRKILSPHEGDVLAIYDVGAYGFSMSSNYHLRKKPKEIII